MGDKTFLNTCENGTLEEVREALAKGADVNERDKVCQMRPKYTYIYSNDFVQTQIKKGQERHGEQKHHQ